MKNFSFRHRLRAVSSALSSLLLASGCHYYGGTGSGTGYSEYDSNNSPPFYRSFQRPQPYDGTPQAPTPQQMPPSVLPMPGYTEPSDVPLPPSPSVQRSKWNLFQSGLKFPGFSRQNSQVNQSNSKNSNQDFSLRTGNSKGSSALPELSSTASIVKRSTVNAHDSDDGMASVRSVSKQDDVELNQAPQMNSSSKNRSGVVHQWPAPKTAPRTQAVDSEPSESNASPVTKSQAKVGTPAGEAPLLLPPPL